MKCPRCNSLLSVPGELAQRYANCPSCQKNVWVTGDPTWSVESPSEETPQRPMPKSKPPPIPETAVHGHSAKFAPVGNEATLSIVCSRVWAVISRWWAIFLWGPKGQETKGQETKSDPPLPLLTLT